MMTPSKSSGNRCAFVNASLAVRSELHEDRFKGIVYEGEPRRCKIGTDTLTFPNRYSTLVGWGLADVIFDQTWLGATWLGTTSEKAKMAKSGTQVGGVTTTTTRLEADLQ